MAVEMVRRQVEENRSALRHDAISIVVPTLAALVGWRCRVGQPSPNSTWIVVRLDVDEVLVLEVAAVEHRRPSGRAEDVGVESQ